MVNQSRIFRLALIPLSLGCLVAGTSQLGDISDERTYWENRREQSTADLMTLETGLKTLQDNEKAYYDGKIAYEAGLKEYEKGKQDLAAGQQEYNDGLALLNQKQQEYDEGVATLTAKQKEYDDGVALLAQKQAEYNQGLTLLNQKQAEYDAGVARLQAAEAELAAGKARLDANRPAYEAGLQKVAAGEQKLVALTADKQAAEQGIQNWESAYHEYTKLKETSPDDPSLAGKKQNLDNAKNTLASELNSAYNRDKADLQEVIKESGTLDISLLTTLANQIFPIFGSDYVKVETALNTVLDILNQINAAGLATLNAGKAQIAEFEQGEATYNAGLAEYAAGQKQLEEGAIALAAGRQQLAEAEPQLAAGRQQLAEGAAQLAAGRQQLQDGAVQLEAGKQKLEAGKAEIETGEQKLTAAEQQLEVGRQQLQEFESGRDQAIAGIDTVLATEPYGDLASISNRLGGENFRYVDSAGNLDILKGLSAVQTARSYQTDNTDAVTGDLTRRLVVAVAIIACGALAAFATLKPRLKLALNSLRTHL